MYVCVREREVKHSNSLASLSLSPSLNKIDLDYLKSPAHAMSPLVTKLKGAASFKEKMEMMRMDIFSLVLLLHRASLSPSLSSLFSIPPLPPLISPPIAYTHRFSLFSSVFLSFFFLFQPKFCPNEELAIYKNRL